MTPADQNQKIRYRNSCTYEFTKLGRKKRRALTGWKKARLGMHWFTLRNLYLYEMTGLRSPRAPDTHHMFCLSSLCLRSASDSQCPNNHNLLSHITFYQRSNFRELFSYRGDFVNLPLIFTGKGALLPEGVWGFVDVDRLNKCSPTLPTIASQDVKSTLW